MDINRVILGISGLFFCTVIYIFSDPLMHGSLYQMGASGNLAIANKISSSWNNVFPVFIIICFYLIISGARTDDYPSQYREY
jgi:hypothetical protein